MTGHVLALDDEPDVREMLSVWLQSEGLRCTPTSTSAEALAAFERDPAQVALIDLRLGQDSGLTAARGLLPHPAGCRRGLRPAAKGVICRQGTDRQRGGASPTMAIKNDMEFVLMQRKPGGYRRPSERQRRQSMIDKERFDEWFRQIWTLTGASTKEHPAPFPLELADRLVRMFSFAGDTVLDPFVGTGTTLVAAAEAGRNSIGVEIDPAYGRLAKERLATMGGLFKRPVIETIGC